MKATNYISPNVEVVTLVPESNVFQTSGNLGDMTYVDGDWN